MSNTPGDLSTSWGLRQLDLLVPPSFETALGYHDEATSLSFFWEFGGLYCDDGINVGMTDMDVWETWTGVSQVRSALEPFNLVSPSTDSDWCLVLFTKDRTFAIGIHAHVVHHLHGPQKTSEETHDPVRTLKLQQEARTSFSNWLTEHHNSGSPKDCENVTRGEIGI